MPGFSTADPIHATLLQGTSLLNCKSGVIGNPGAAGAPRDSLFYGVYIIKNAGPGAVNVGGFADNTGTAQNFAIAGLTSQDQFFTPPEPMLNDFAALTFTPTVAGVVWAFTRSYTGP